MFSSIAASTVQGIDAQPVQVEVDLRPGLPGLHLVGLPDAAVREARDRVRSAICNAGFDFPLRRITVNLAPADLPKDGTDLDVPIALGILTAAGLLDGAAVESWMVTGELSLNGEIRAVRGVVPRAGLAHRLGKRLLVPEANLDETRGLGVEAEGIRSLQHLVQVVRGEERPIGRTREEGEAIDGGGAEAPVSFEEVVGQDTAKLALMCLAAGGHNVLLCGPPGSGKTLLAQSLRGLLPPLRGDEIHEVAAIYSAAGVSRPASRLRERPLRAPHHSASAAAVVGGGPTLRPGEVSLAHRGVLFLDELPEFNRRVLETLRGPVEEGVVRLARARGCVDLPARFSLVAAMNCCPCGGYRGLSARRRPGRGATCRCLPGEVARYQARVSGPLRDRFDAFVLMESVDPSVFFHRRASPMRAAERVRAAVRRQEDRYGPGRRNAGVALGELVAAAGFGAQQQTWLQDHARARGQHLSHRGLVRLVRLSRTLADLDDSDAIDEGHVARAVALRDSEAALVGT